MKILLLNISDIHVTTKDRPENEGLVLRKFIEDVETLVVSKKKFSYDDVFVLISGDLVFAASDESYAKFDELIVQELMRVLEIDRSHFIIAPGNHDVTQNTVKDVEDAFLPMFNSKYVESKFNDLIRKKALKTIVFGKFDAFKRYMEDTMSETYSLLANIREINDIWSVHILNSAILSCGGFNGIDDQGHLGVDTRSLHKFLSEDKHPKKILLMHHPEYFCMDWVKTELRKVYLSDYSVVLSGHTHDQYVYCENKDGYIRCEAPQLYTDKNDNILGYNFIELVDDKVVKITYRQWGEKRNKFRVGSDFVDDDDSNGVIIFEDAETNKQNKVADRSTKLEGEQLKKEKKSLSSNPQVQAIDNKSGQSENGSSQPQSETTDTNDSHPQAIDLGLRSGTKWASCNVDDDPLKQSPTNFGSYYAWGETEKKEIYNWKTYTHCDGSFSTCHNLGSDIAGTKYDVAHVKWGGNWCMPTKKDFEELLDNCKTEWTTLNGVMGRKFIGPNGNSIFLPAAGTRWLGSLFGAGSSGNYWSSTQTPSGSGNAYRLYFNSGLAYWYRNSRIFGHTVRPVSKN